MPNCAIGGARKVAKATSCSTVSSAFNGGRSDQARSRAVIGHELEAPSHP